MTPPIFLRLSQLVSQEFNRDLQLLLLTFPKPFGLLYKFFYYGISSKLYCEISSYLTNRRISVVVNKDLFSFSSVNTGVPQGSVLTPTVSILNITTPNILHSHVINNTLHIYFEILQYLLILKRTIIGQSICIYHKLLIGDRKPLYNLTHSVTGLETLMVINFILEKQELFSLVGVTSTMLAAPSSRCRPEESDKTYRRLVHSFLYPSSL